eukprot:1081240-Pyramimonas_sp.AAC.1
MAGDDDATKSRLFAERNRLCSHRVGPRIDNSETITACEGFYTQNALDRLSMGLTADALTTVFAAGPPDGSAAAGTRQL